MCDYELESGKKCHLEQYGSSPFCVLHTDFPDDTTGDEYQHLLEQKYKKIQEKIKSDDFDFRGLIFNDFILPEKFQIITSILFNNAKIRGEVRFNEASILGDVRFERAMIHGHVKFDGADIDGNVRFDGTTIERDAWFNGAKIKGAVTFKYAIIKEGAWFYNAMIGDDTNFTGAIIEGGSHFDNVIIKRDALFNGATLHGDARFKNARINGISYFVGAAIDGKSMFDGAILYGDAWFTQDKKKVGKIKGDISLISTRILGKLIFNDSFFEDLHAREQINRLAKKMCEEHGEKHDADEYYYKEMVARREQKNKTQKYFDLIFLDGIFGYGVKPSRLIITWFFLVGLCSSLYYFGNGLVNTNSLIGSVYYSVVTAATPGYGGIQPQPGLFQGIATIEAIFGTLMWAAFLATFVRKYAR